MHYKLKANRIMKPKMPLLLNVKRAFRTVVYAVFILFLIMTINNCSNPGNEINITDDTDQTKPPVNNEPGSNDLKGNTNVDKNGGKTFKGNINITVPADAFSTAVKMEIPKQTVNSVMQEYETSEYYKVKLPQNFTKPLKYQLPANTKIKEEDVLFRFYAPGMQISGQNENHFAQWVKATKGDDFL